MVFLSFHELLPLSITHAGRHAAIASLMVGMATMSFTLNYVNTHLLAGHHH
jgi:zinc transporter ZupT